MQEETKTQRAGKNKATKATKKPGENGPQEGKGKGAKKTVKKSSSTNVKSSSKGSAKAKATPSPGKAAKSAKPARASNVPASVRQTPQSHGYFIAAILIILGAVLFLMLFTFSEKDLAPDAEQALNLFGVVGAWISNILLTLFGLASFFFPAICLLKGLTTFCAKPLDVKPSELVGLTMLLIASSPLLNVLMDGTQVLGHAPGGVLGTYGADLALQHMSVNVLMLSSALVSFFGLLLVTDTSLKSFFIGLVKCLKVIFTFLATLVSAPIMAYKNRPLKSDAPVPMPEDMPDPLDDPLSEETTNDLLGSLAEEPPAASETGSESLDTSQHAAPEAKAETTHAATDEALTQAASNEDELPHDIIDKLDDDNDLDPSSGDEDLVEEGKNSGTEQEDSPDDGIAAILGKIIPGKAKMRSTRRNKSVPAIEPNFEFNSIVNPEQLDGEPVSEENGSVAASLSTSTSGILGNWKPRNIGKRAALHDHEPPRVTAEVLTGDKKSFAPEAAMDTLALAPETGFRQSHNITNDILAQCDESYPSAEQAAKSTHQKSLEQVNSGEKKSNASDEQKTGCVGACELAELVKDAQPEGVPSEDELRAFFKSSESGAGLGEETRALLSLQGVLDDFRPSGSSRAGTRDIMIGPSSGLPTQSDKSSQPTNALSIDELIAHERPTRPFSLKDIGTSSTDKSARTANVREQNDGVRSPGASDMETKERLQAHETRATLARDELCPTPRTFNEKSTRFAQPAEPTPKDAESSANSEDIELLMEELLKKKLNDSAQQSEKKPFKAPIYSKPVVPAKSEVPRVGFSVSEAHKRASEDEINEAERERRSSEDQRSAYQRPSLDLLNYNATTQKGYSQEELEVIAKRIEDKFAEFKLTGQVTHICPGPVVTRFEFKPAPGIKVARFSDLAHDLMMALEIVSVRILAPIPGKGVVGIEIPNEHRNTIYLKEVLASAKFKENKSVLKMALGQDTEGNPFVTNLAKMPHILVAGTTGSGKSVGINTMLCSILYNATPDQVRLILVDPKCLELSIYEGIPHLLTPPITTPKETSAALDWACEEMERRYRLLQDIGVRNIENYNETIKRACEEPDDADPRVVEKLELLNDDGTPKHRPLSYIVIVIDEFADLMMVARKEIETQVARLAQKARAAGINMILATQRPSTNVITGVIKANFPARLAFKVQAVVDSSTILGHKGAEALLGRGDSIFQDPTTGLETRVHGCFVSDEEVQKVVDHLCKQGEPEYDQSITAPRQSDEDSVDSEDDSSGRDIHDDPIYQRAIDVIRQTRKASASSLQRELGIGYPKAGKIINQMEKDGLISPADSKHNREIYI